MSSLVDITEDGKTSTVTSIVHYLLMSVSIYHWSLFYFFISSLPLYFTTYRHTTPFKIYLAGPFRSDSSTQNSFLDFFPSLVQYTSKLYTRKVRLFVVHVPWVPSQHRTHNLLFVIQSCRPPITYSSFSYPQLRSLQCYYFPRNSVVALRPKICFSLLLVTF